ncbi:hypothetical protein MNB_SV-6-232 [hydrothermal vent metagenome]|uniref:Lipoprotein n=1 Tax=hydrothermal vent metagenome TaxID=652676 RepID=A0A1W1CDQ0_9ZZZZ
MKLTKADKPVINYPSRYIFKPMLLNVGIAILLGGCANSRVKEPSLLAGGMIGDRVAKSQQSCNASTDSGKEGMKEETKEETKEEVKEEVKEPEILGGIPPVQPPKLED